MLITLPILALFNYIVAHRLIEDARNYDNPSMWGQFFYIVIATGIFHLLAILTFILICLGAFSEVRLWRVLTTVLVM